MPMDPFHGVAAVFRLQVHADGAGATGKSSDHGGARADEGVEHDAAPRATEVQAPLYELDRVRREVRAGILGTGDDLPDIFFADQARPVKPVARVFGEQEYV